VNRRPGPGAAKQQWLFGRIKAVSARAITGLLTTRFRPERAVSGGDVDAFPTGLWTTTEFVTATPPCDRPLPRSFHAR